MSTISSVGEILPGNETGLADTRPPAYIAKIIDRPTMFVAARQEVIVNQQTAAAKTPVRSSLTVPYACLSHPGFAFRHHA